MLLEHSVNRAINKFGSWMSFQLPTRKLSDVSRVPELLRWGPVCQRVRDLPIMSLVSMSPYENTRWQGLEELRRPNEARGEI